MRNTLRRRLAELERVVPARCRREPDWPFRFAAAELAWLEGGGPKPQEPRLVPPHTPQSWTSLIRIARGLKRGTTTADMTPEEAERVCSLLETFQRSAEVCLREGVAFDWLK